MSFPFLGLLNFELLDIFLHPGLDVPRNVFQMKECLNEVSCGSYQMYFTCKAQKPIIHNAQLQFIYNLSHHETEMT